MFLLKRELYREILLMLLIYQVHLITQIKTLNFFFSMFIFLRFYILDQSSSQKIGFIDAKILLKDTILLKYLIL